MSQAWLHMLRETLHLFEMLRAAVNFLTATHLWEVPIVIRDVCIVGTFRCLRGGWLGSCGRLQHESDCLKIPVSSNIFENFSCKFQQCADNVSGCHLLPYDEGSQSQLCVL